ncbi:MAG: 23S rRNA pseudouridine1911/1915/1917 synthase [Candidatus Paceibacteria bacterium]|jgi:23S rRNA pseudouridine1911/1915/1917 synthase
MSLEIIFEDNNILAVNKPAGLVVHSDGKTKEETLTDLILKEYPEVQGVGEPLELKDKTVIDRPGIVHRLDRDTSGVILIAKNQESHSHLKKQFQDREIEKTYHSFVYGNIKEDDGVIDRPIGRSKKDFRQWSAQRGARGVMREAVTNFKVLDRGQDGDEHYTFVEVKPKTGRTHQIRVHMKAFNHPVVCDKLYAESRLCILGFKRLALHARKISFKDLNGDMQEVEAPYADDFVEAMI